jgi:hypothetical protein
MKTNQIHINDFLINRECRFNRQAALRNARIIDQTIHPIAPRKSCVQELGQGRVIRCFKRQDQTAICTTLRRHLFKGGLIAAREDDVGALLGQLARKSGANA